MTANAFYPIGAVGRPWGEPERAAWRARQLRQRSYADDVVARIDKLTDRFQKIAYGQLAYGDEAYVLYALRSRPVEAALPTVLVTGGVHGYETSGVLGALEFLERRAGAYAGRANLLVIPCVSPWSYERACRWNFDAIDPNRSFRDDGPSEEANGVMAVMKAVSARYLLHIDLHETTDSDETEFRPALSARDGRAFEPGTIPDGFYLVADSQDPQPAFQQAIISAIQSDTHIAEPDATGKIIGSPVIARGVIALPLVELGLCTSITSAPFTTTTEVYPDSPRTTAAHCIRAQVTAVCAALDFTLTRGLIR